MQLSFRFICEALNLKQIHWTSPATPNLMFEHPAMPDASEAFLPGVLYLCSQEQMVPSPENRKQGFLWLGQTPPPEGSCALWVQDKLSYPGVCNRVFALFHRFDIWSGRVMTAAAGKRPMAEFFDLLTEVTPNPWYFCDCSFRMIAIKQETDYCEISPIWRFYYAHGYLPLDVIYTLYSGNELERMNRAARAVMVKKSLAFAKGNDFVSKTIFQNAAVVGHLFLIGMFRPVSSYELEILEFFGNALELYLQDSHLLTLSTGRFFDQFFCDLVDGRSFEPEELTRAVETLKWDLYDRFRCIAFSVGTGDGLDKALANHLIHVLEESMPVRVFLHKEQVVAILNISQFLRSTAATDFEEIFSESLLKILPKYDCSAGYSEVFTGLRAISHYYKQACGALQYADVRGCMLQGYPQIAAHYLLSDLRGHLDPALCSHPAVAILKKYDQDNGTELLGTLSCYLRNEQSTLHTAQALFLHRNSLMYRLTKIRQLTGICPENYADRLRLEMALFYEIEEQAMVPQKSEPPEVTPEPV